MCSRVIYEVILKKTTIMICVISLLISFCSCGKQKELSYHITETYRITSSNHRESHLLVDLPICYGYQTIANIDIKNVDDYFFEPRSGYQTLHTTLKGNGRERTISVSYDVALKIGKCSWKDETKEKYLLPEEFIDSDNQSILDLANTLSGNNNKYQTAKNISHYVSKNIKFDSSTKINEETPLASKVLSKKKGVCQDYANLMTALLRASGIPAKKISGLVLTSLKASSDWSSPAGSHAWVEFNVDGAWYTADPTWGDDFFAYSDGYHLSYGLHAGNIDSQTAKLQINEIENKGFTIIGGMTAPIMFTAYSEDEKASIIPRVDISKN